MRQFFNAIRQANLNLQFKANGKRQVQILEYPGRWMNEHDLADIQDGLRGVAQKTIPAGDLNYGVFSTESDSLSRSIITLVKNQDSQVIAFNALAVMPVELHDRTTDVLHLGLVMVDPDERSKGLSWILYGLTCFLLFVRNGMRPLFISNVTQVPAVVGLVGETFSAVFPTPDKTDNTDFEKLLLARGIMSAHRFVFGVGDEAEFDENSFVIKNAYTGGSDHLKKTFDEAAKHRLDHYNEFCKQQLDYQRGDDLLQIGRIDLAAASNYATRSVPKGSILSVLALGMLMTLQRVVLPMVHWFSADKHFGNLRPVK